ncbi:TonB-dependent receptor family protein [Croceiramulus getboli]|nr:TonB-dependent receptor [Flavobacteriaceae bacterium YJPT1-3]
MKRFTFLLIGLLSGVSYAQIPATDSLSTSLVLQEVLLQGSVQKAIQLDALPAAINRIEPELLQQYDQTSLAPALNRTPGVFMQQGALNTARIVIRGIGARSPFSTNRIKAFFEGIPITTGEGTTSLEDIDPGLIESVTLIKGPNSSIYGAGLGGAILLQARTPQRTEASLTTQLSSFNTVRTLASAAWADESYGLRVSYNRLNADGYRANSGYNREGVTAFAKANLNERHQLHFFGNYTQLKAFIPSSLNAEDFAMNPERAAFNWAQARGFESYDKVQAGLSWRYDLGADWKFTLSVFTNYRDGYEPRPFDILDDEEASWGLRNVLRKRIETETGTLDLTAGFTYFDERYTLQLFENNYEDNAGNGSVQGDQLDALEEDRRYLDVFLQGSWNFAEDWLLDAGLSFNTTFYRLKDGTRTGAEDRSGDYRYANQWSPRIGLSYELLPQRFLYATVSSGFSVPTVAETLTPDGEINTDIRPETGVNYELGFKGDWLNGRLHTELAVYRIAIDNLLVADRIAEDRFVGINAGATRHDGVELQFQFLQQLGTDWVIEPYLNAAVNAYQFEDFQDDGIDFSGNDLTGVPLWVGSGGLALTYRKHWRLDLNGQHVDEIPLNDENNLYSEAYNLLQLQGSHTFTILDHWNVRLYAGVNNLTDTRYAAQILPNARGFGGNAPRYFYPGNPRNYYGGIRLNYMW